MTSEKLLIEVCVDSVDSAILAVRGGADRLELCGSLGLGGGTTPSLGLFKAVRRAVPDTPIMVMVRPRAGDFLYTTWELETMLEDISTFKEAGATGVVLGLLTAKGLIDVERTTRLANEAHPMQVCFHRAFDMAQEPSHEEDPERDEQLTYQSLRTIASIPGITRVLTSGRARNVLSGMTCLRGFLQDANTLAKQRGTSHVPLSILPGSGISPKAIGPLLDSLLPEGLREIHLSAGKWVPSEMQFRPEGMGMGIGAGEWGIWRTEEETVREVRQIADAAWARRAEVNAKSS